MHHRNHQHSHRPSIISTNVCTTVGDTTYTGDTAAPRMMLHAARLSLPFPANDGRVCSYVRSVVWCVVLSVFSCVCVWKE